MFKKSTLTLSSRFLNFKSIVYGAYTNYLTNMMNIKLNTRTRRRFVKCLLGTFTLYQLHGKTSTLFCYKTNNPQLEKFVDQIESSIKNLEFKYHGTMHRQPIK